MSDQAQDQVAAEPPVVAPTMRERIAASMLLIQADMENDARETEGMAFTGRNVGELFGGVMAAVDAVAKAVEWLAMNGEKA